MLCLQAPQHSSWLDVAGADSAAYFAVRFLQSTVAWLLPSNPTVAAIVEFDENNGPAMTMLVRDWKLRSGSIQFGAIRWFGLESDCCCWCCHGMPPEYVHQAAATL